ncbi:hypothetical protein AXG93_369s1450 [Marchantia polymorpha subsp. ruderalis]|uniref:Uncharacterized protein n=1 Tax=Marchantia polymorpha subsp. ruderalis TaxID=1480154 RepID=A0A176VTZ7_MARPO|nr:hypothetical protein AXG93_369s1450 [Marchantia polymorpha subsp. ruderalis]
MLRSKNGNSEPMSKVLQELLVHPQLNLISLLLLWNLCLPFPSLPLPKLQGLDWSLHAKHEKRGKPHEAMAEKPLRRGREGVGHPTVTQSQLCIALSLVHSLEGGAPGGLNIRAPEVGRPVVTSAPCRALRSEWGMVWVVPDVFFGSSECPRRRDKFSCLMNLLRKEVSSPEKRSVGVVGLSGVDPHDPFTTSGQACQPKSIPHVLGKFPGSSVHGVGLKRCSVSAF